MQQISIVRTVCTSVASWQLWQPMNNLALFVCPLLYYLLSTIIYSHCGPHWHWSRADGVTSLLVMSWRGLITNCVRGLPYNIYTPAQGYPDIIYNLHIDGLYRYLVSARCDIFPRYIVSPLSYSDHVTPCHRHTQSAGRIHATLHSLEPEEKMRGKIYTCLGNIFIRTFG